MPGLEDLYKEIILDHYRNPRLRGTLEVPPAHMAEGFNPLCGDEVKVYLDVVDGRLAELRIDGQGCSISRSSASMMAAALQGRPLEEVHRVIEAFNAMMSMHEATLDDGTAVDEHGLVGFDDISEADDELGDLVALRGVLKFESRIKCARLSWDTITRCLTDINAD